MTIGAVGNARPMRRRRWPARRQRRHERPPGVTEATSHRQGVEPEGYHREMTSPRPPRRCRAVPRATVDPAYTWDLSSIFATGRRGKRRSRRSSRRSSAIAGTRARWRRAATAAAAPTRSRRARPARVPRLVLRRAAVRPGSARQHDQRPPSAGAAADRALAAGDVVVQPGTAAHPARDRAGMDGRLARPWRSIASSSRTCSASRQHVLDEAGERLLSLSSRLSSRARTTPTRRSRRPTRGSRRSRCRPANRCR